MDDLKKIKELNQAFFDKIEIDFFNVSGQPVEEFFNKRLTASFTKFLRYIPPESVANKIILDAGCNDGYFFDFYRALGAKWVAGCDLSRKAIVRGIERKHGILRQRGINGKNFIQCDLEYMPIKDGTFDSIFCFGTWHHIPGRDAFLKECKRVLRKDGFLIISDPNETQPLRGWINKIGLKMGVLMEHENHTSPAFALSMLKEYGFVQTRIYYFNLFSESAARFWGLLFKKNRFFYFIGFLFLIFPLIDAVMEKTVLKLFPRLSWTYIIIGKKSGE